MANSRYGRAAFRIQPTPVICRSKVAEQFPSRWQWGMVGSVGVIAQLNFASGGRGIAEMVSVSWESAEEWWYGEKMIGVGVRLKVWVADGAEPGQARVRAEVNDAQTETAYVEGVGQWTTSERSKQTNQIQCEILVGSGSFAMYARIA